MNLIIFAGEERPPRTHVSGKKKSSGSSEPQSARSFRGRVVLKKKGTVMLENQRGPNRRKVQWIQGVSSKGGEVANINGKGESHDSLSQGRGRRGKQTRKNLVHIKTQQMNDKEMARKKTPNHEKGNSFI